MCVVCVCVRRVGGNLLNIIFFSFVYFIFVALPKTRIRFIIQNMYSYNSYVVCLRYRYAFIYILFVCALLFYVLFSEMKSPGLVGDIYIYMHFAYSLCCESAPYTYYRNGAVPSMDGLNVCPNVSVIMCTHTLHTLSCRVWDCPPALATNIREDI